MQAQVLRQHVDAQPFILRSTSMSLCLFFLYKLTIVKLRLFTEDLSKSKKKSYIQESCFRWNEYSFSSTKPNNL